MRIKWRRVGARRADCGWPDVDEWIAAGSGRSGGACEGGGEGRSCARAGRSERPIRVHHISSEREPVCGRPERRVGGRSGRRASCCIGSGEELSRALVLFGTTSPWSAWKFFWHRASSRRIERSDDRELTLVVSQIADASLPTGAPAKAEPPARGAAIVPAAARASEENPSVESISQRVLGAERQPDRSHHLRLGTLDLPLPDGFRIQTAWCWILPARVLIHRKSTSPAISIPSGKSGWRSSRPRFRV